MQHSSGLGFTVEPKDEYFGNSVVKTHNSATIEEHSSIYQGETPFYHRKLRSKELLPYQPLTATNIKGSSSGNWNIYDEAKPDYPAYTADMFTPWISPVTLDPRNEDSVMSFVGSSLDDAYVEAAMAKLYTQGWDALTFGAEVSKLKDMLFGAVGRLGALLKSTDPKLWASAWLEGRYGWRVLYYDMRSLYSALTELQNLQSEFYTARVGGNISSSFERTIEISTPSVWSASFNIVHDVNVNIRASAISKIKFPVFRTNVALTAWELIPFSFVIDWFLSVGTSIAALSAAKVHADIRSALGYRATISTYGYLSDFQTYGTWKGSKNSTFQATTTLTRRVPWEPDFLPSFNVNLDSFKVTDLLAIIYQRLK